jgi:hypothetical protein
MRMILRQNFWSISWGDFSKKQLPLPWGRVYLERLRDLCSGKSSKLDQISTDPEATYTPHPSRLERDFHEGWNKTISNILAFVCSSSNMFLHHVVGWGLKVFAGSDSLLSLSQRNCFSDSSGWSHRTCSDRCGNKCSSGQGICMLESLLKIPPVFRHGICSFTY